MSLLSGCSKLDVYLDVLATSSLKEHTARGHKESMELFGVLAIEVSYILSRNPSKSFLNSLQVHIPHPKSKSEPDSKRTFQNGTAKSCFDDSARCAKPRGGQGQYIIYIYIIYTVYIIIYCIYCILGYEGVSPSEWI